MRRPLLGLLLFALLFRAYIPVGFMPASGTPFLLKVCPMGMQGAMLGQHPAGGHAHAEDCPFGCAPAAGPIPHTIAYEPGRLLAAGSIDASHAAEIATRRERAHPPRGPPALA